MAKKSIVKKKLNKKIIPLFLMMFVPIIMYYQNIEYDTVLTRPYYVQAVSYVDLFSFYKSIAIYVIAILCIAFYVLYTRKRDMELKKDRLKYYIPVAVYSLFIILSTIFAIFPKIAIFGLYERFEGALVLLSYFIFMIYALEVLKDEIDLNYFFVVFLGMVFIISTIGIIQYFIVDIFTIKFFQLLVGIPKDAFVDTHFSKMAYGTLYNPNNLGQFAAMTAPMSAGIMLAFKSKKGKIFAAVTLLLSLLAGYASGSANFFAGIAFAALLFFILYASHLIPRNKKLRIALFILVGLIAVGTIAMSGKIWNRISKTELVRTEIESLYPPIDDVYFKDVTYSADTISFETTQGTFYLKYLGNGISFYDSEMNYLEFEQIGGTIRFIEQPYRRQWGAIITSESTLDIIAKRSFGSARIGIVFDEEKFLGIRGTGGRILQDIMDNQMPEKFHGLETIASRRGYLWIVSISRFDEVFFIGAGPDSFLYWFEQNDVVGKINLLHTTSILADKPHNWFIQIATQTGVLSLLAFLAMMGIYAVSSLRLLGVRRKKTYYEFVSSGILCGLIGYMASSLFVDSTVGTTPIFFVFLGIGIFANEQIKNMRKKDKNISARKRLKIRNK